jgi:hypothetical protein
MAEDGEALGVPAMAYRVLIAQFMHETNTFSNCRPRSTIIAGAG